MRSNQIFYYLHHLSRLFGSYPFSIHKNNQSYTIKESKPWQIYSLIFAIIALTLSTYGYTKGSTASNIFVYIRLASFMFCEISISAFILTAFIKIQWNTKTLQNITEIICKCDKIISKLQISTKNIQKIQHLVIAEMVLLLILIYTKFFAKIFHYGDGLLFLINFFVIYQSMFFIVSGFVLQLDSLYQRFVVINQYLEKVIMNLKKDLLIKDFDWFQYMKMRKNTKIVSILHQSLCEGANLYNRIIGFPILMLMLGILLVMSTTLYILLQFMAHPEQWKTHKTFWIFFGLQSNCIPLIVGYIIFMACDYVVHEVSSLFHSIYVL